jgi:hypothetical protein
MYDPIKSQQAILLTPVLRAYERRISCGNSAAERHSWAREPSGNSSCATKLMKLSPAPRNLVFGGGVLIVLSVCGDGFVRSCELHGVNPIKALACGVAVLRTFICCRKPVNRTVLKWGLVACAACQYSIERATKCNLVEPAWVATRSSCNSTKNKENTQSLYLFSSQSWHPHFASYSNRGLQLRN